jgi:hypothetical protein
VDLDCQANARVYNVKSLIDRSVGQIPSFRSTRTSHSIFYLSNTFSRMGIIQQLSGSSHDITMDDLLEKSRGFVLGAWARTTRRMRAAAGFLIFL